MKWVTSRVNQQRKWPWLTTKAKEEDSDGALDRLLGKKDRRQQEYLDKKDKLKHELRKAELELQMKQFEAKKKQERTGMLGLMNAMMTRFKNN